MPFRTMSVCHVLFCLCNLLLTKGDPLGGDNVKKVSQNNLDFVVSIAHSDQYLSWKESHFCTGTLITYKHVLTSEKCLLGKAANQIVLHIGSPHAKKAKIFEACKLVTHSSWALEMDNEITGIGNESIGVITLCKIVKPHKIRPASISFAAGSREATAEAIVAGWGSLQDGSKSLYLRKATVEILSRTNCQEETDGKSGDGKILCSSATPYVMIKPGDAGGPLFDAQNKIIGVSTGTWFMGKRNPDSIVNTHFNLEHYTRFLSNFIRIYHVPS